MIHLQRIMSYSIPLAFFSCVLMRENDGPIFCQQFIYPDMVKMKVSVHDILTIYGLDLIRPITSHSKNQHDLMLVFNLFQFVPEFHNVK